MAGAVSTVTADGVLLVHLIGLSLIHISPFVLFLNLALMGFESYWMLTDTPFWSLWCPLCVVLMAILNFNSLWDTVRHVLAMGRRR